MAACSRTIIHFLDLPEIVIEKIMSFLSFEELAQQRIVCRRFDGINQMLLNKGFRQVDKYQEKCLREVKRQLPRRESERRNHPLFRHCDILMAIETRLSLLKMTFMKYVDNQACCFIPGKVIDEVYRVLHFVQSYKNKTLPRTYEILTELRDISSMAMEHFEDKIVSSLKPVSLASKSPRFSLSSAITSPFASASSGTSGSHSKSPAPSPSVVLNDLATANKFYKCYISALKKDVDDMNSKVTDLRQRMSEQERVTLEQNRVISEQAIKLTSQEGKLAELSRKMMEYDQRLNERLGGGGGGSGVTRDKQGGSSSNTTNNWARYDHPQQQQFYVTHGLTTSAIRPAVFVPANIIQPNFNLSGGGLPSSPYLPSSPLPGFSSNVSSGVDSSSLLSPAVTPPAGYSASQCMQGSLARCSNHSPDSTSQLDNISLVGSTTSSEADSIDRSCRKRKYMDGDDRKDSHSKHLKF